MAELEVTVYCYWNGCIKDSPNGIYYEGSTLRLIIVKRKTEFNGLLDQLYQVTGLDRSRSTFDIIGRYPSSVKWSMVKYKPLHVVDDTSLETMLEVPSIHPSILHVDLFLEVKSTSDQVINPAACSSPLANPGSSSKRQRIDIPVKSERERETDRNSGSDRVVHAVDLTGDSSISDKDSNSGVSKPCMSSLWLDDHEKIKINPLQYVDDCYSVERYCKTYAATFSPVPEVSAWPEASGVPTLFPPSPPN